MEIVLSMWDENWMSYSQFQIDIVKFQALLCYEIRKSLINVKFFMEKYYVNNNIDFWKS